MKKIKIFYLVLLLISVLTPSIKANSVNIYTNVAHNGCKGTEVLYTVSIRSYGVSIDNQVIEALLPEGISYIAYESPLGTYEYLTGKWFIPFNQINFAQLTIRGRICSKNIGTFRVISGNSSSQVNPFQVTSCDNDYDGIPDLYDNDDDNDGVADEAEYTGNVTPGFNLIQNSGIFIYNDDVPNLNLKNNLFNQFQTSFPGDIQFQTAPERNFEVYEAISTGNVIVKKNIKIHPSTRYRFSFYTSAVSVTQNTYNPRKIYVFINNDKTGSFEVKSESNFDIWERNEISFTSPEGIEELKLSVEVENGNLPVAFTAVRLEEVSYSFTLGNPTEDADGDGILNYLDAKFGKLNNKGVVAQFDSDNDGFINSMDPDSDNDGMPDMEEWMGFDEFIYSSSELNTTASNSTVSPETIINIASKDNSRDDNNNGWSDLFEVFIDEPAQEATKINAKTCPEIIGAIYALNQQKTRVNWTTVAEERIAGFLVIYTSSDGKVTESNVIVPHGNGNRTWYSHEISSTNIMSVIIKVMYLDGTEGYSTSVHSGNEMIQSASPSFIKGL